MKKMKTPLSPSDLEVLIHYHTTPTWHPRRDAPAVIAGTKMFLDCGMIQNKGLSPDADWPYTTSEKGRAFIQALCCTPEPECSWYISGNRYPSSTVCEEDTDIQTQNAEEAMTELRAGLCLEPHTPNKSKVSANWFICWPNDPKYKGMDCYLKTGLLHLLDPLTEWSTTGDFGKAAMFYTAESARRVMTKFPKKWMKIKGHLPPRAMSRKSDE